MRLEGGRVPSYLLVMTACVDPRNAPVRLHRSDPLTRLEDYRGALKFWLHYPDPRVGKILFIENSGFPLQPLRETAAAENRLSKAVEFVSLDCNYVPENVHYGYAELSMLDAGLPSSGLLKDSTHFIKATGRLRFPGLTRLLDRLPRDYDFAVDCRRNTRFVRTAQEFVTTQLMIFSVPFYERHLRDVKSGMGEEASHIENLLYRELMKFSNRPGAILRWPVNVDPHGHAAHWEKDYRSGRQRLVNAGRAVCRVVCPRWWV